MRLNSRHLALIAAAACASIAPASALAGPYTPIRGRTTATAAVASCVRNYSLNSVSGGYCASDGRDLLETIASRAVANRDRQA